MTIPSRSKRCRSTGLLSAWLGTFAPIAIAAFGIQGVQASKIVPFKFTCPIGGQKFTGKVVSSGFQQGQRLDLRPFGWIVSPFPLPVCPGNGFVMYKDEFSAAELVKLESIVQSRDYQRQSKRNVPYYMSAYLQRRMGAADLELAHLFLAASWESEGHWSPHGKSENGDGVSPAAERKRRQSAYRAMALKKLDSFLTQNSERTEQWWRATALGIELARLLHRFDDAKTRLNALPLQELPLNSKTGKLIAQIREQVTRRNANPEVFVTE